MTNTTYYNLNIAEGTDIVNPLTVDNPNYEKIDEAMHDNAVAGVTLATELTNATIHALTRENSDCSVIRFIATSRWKAGDSVTVDGVPVLALLPSGETLPDGAYVINANVLCVLTGTNLTVYIGKSATDANEIAYNDTNVGEELNALNDSVATVSSELSKLTNKVSTLTSNVATINSNLNVDFSNSSATSVNELLQYIADEFFPLTLKLIDNGVWNSKYPIEELIGSGTYTTSDGYFKSISTSGGYRTVSKIDLTEYNTITFNGKSAENNNSVFTELVVAPVSDVTSGVISGKLYTTTESSIILDVSALSGEYYVGLNTYKTTSFTKSIEIA